MRISFYMLALVPLVFIGCAAEPPTTVTTTTTTQEVTTTTPGTVPVTREVFVTQAPPAVRIEAETVSPGPGYNMDTGLLALGGNKLCVGAWELGCTSKTGRCLGPRPLGKAARRMGVGSGSLAVGSSCVAAKILFVAICKFKPAAS